MVKFLVNIIVCLTSTVWGVVYGMKYSSREIINEKKLSAKHLDLLKIAVRWIKEPDKIERYLHKNEYKKIGIYGMSYLGDTLQEILRNRGFEIVYGIDKNADKIYNQNVPIYTLDDELSRVDLIIVTVIDGYEQIKHELEIKFKHKVEIISLDIILYN